MNAEKKAILRGIAQNSKCCKSKVRKVLRIKKSTSWKHIPPSATDTHTKVVKGNKFHWCAKCGRWSTTHDTASHWGKETDDTNVHLSVDPSAWHFDFSFLSLVEVFLSGLFVLWVIMEPYILQFIHFLKNVNWHPKLSWLEPLLWSVILFGVLYISNMNETDDSTRRERRILQKRSRMRNKRRTRRRTRTQHTRTLRVRENFVSARERAIISQTVKACLKN